MQKLTFHHAKGRILHAKRPPFAKPVIFSVLRNAIFLTTVRAGYSDKADRSLNAGSSRFRAKSMATTAMAPPT